MIVVFLMLVGTITLQAKESEVISGCLLYVLEIPDAKSWPQLRVCWNETEWSRASVVLGIPGTPDEPCLR